MLKIDAGLNAGEVLNNCAVIVTPFEWPGICYYINSNEMPFHVAWWPKMHKFWVDFRFQSKLLTLMLTIGKNGLQKPVLKENSALGSRDI